ncbi:helix-turn-helix domain-containing protein [Cupriavidus taiwanensis]|uniref:helix-turn-helix domain-containing protein n=1 Tax=Cupriavidus taiwanensis TaxID=164546 RepID=UPI000E104434|nr:helix-turn-helix domain containing protein [Cupriavidus taiwanensis]SOY61638.1 conserved hypothetical protein [Cupriavidus taiwanensis]SOY63042.1 conserved hypothetical protein [Cupriavidus taiwanensis]SOY98133.1 conserved hypothetical protein [Cupriavidus taiwanensis]SOZ85171.1 conserved hypothetical protein [Cupriavidus taiwanensis]SOZ88626.1 conserved hypothetical protein [Cupriavidus taiwanensis]
MIPAALQDIAAWPDIDVSNLDENARRGVARKKEAIALYIAGYSFKAIATETLISDDTLRRIIKRCLAVAPDKRIFGFRALYPGLHVVTYKRSKSAARNFVGGTICSSGYAGALGQLFDRFPWLRERVINQFLGRNDDGEYVEARKSIANIHKEFFEELKGKLKPSEWPLHTKNRGYSALRKYLHALLKTRPTAYIRERSGEEAARHLMIGRGHPRLIQAWMPFSILELDYVRQDAPGYIEFEDRYGQLHRLLVARWYVGLLADECTGGVCGYHVAYEAEPSADTALQTVLSSLMPVAQDDVAPLMRDVVPEHASLLPNLILLYARQGCCLLKVDNGWANVANDFVNNVIDVLGCAVEFGVPRAWWLRPFIERLNGKLAERGLHRLRCTYGSGPHDPRRHQPEKEAALYTLRDKDLTAILDAVIAEHHTVFTPEKFFRSTIRDILEGYATRPELDWVPQPLPISSEPELRLLMHKTVATVRGSVKKGVRPYVQFDRCRYTNQRLSSDFTLIGQKVELQVQRMDIRKAWAVLLSTGQDLGQLNPDARWADWKYSILARQVMNRKALACPAERDPRVVHEVIKARRQALIEQKPKKRSKREALEIAKLQRQIAYDPAEGSTRSSAEHGSREPRGIFGEFRNTRRDDDV